MTRNEAALPPGCCIGILGGGQLGRMMVLAAAQMGYRTAIYSPINGECAKQVTDTSFTAPYTDFDSLQRFAEICDVITIEFENIPLPCIVFLEEMGIRVAPNSRILAVCQNRLLEKEFMARHNIPTNRNMRIAEEEDITAAAAFPFPGVLKTATEGYDGKGQQVIHTYKELEGAWGSLRQQPAILEQFVDFEREISVIVARGISGETKAYPPVHNIHYNGILAETRFPSHIPPGVEEKAVSIAISISKYLDLCGILAVEMFVDKAGDLLVNELAPRPHNSGHWTMEAATTSQFHQVIRAICGLPLGSTQLLARTAVMHNLIGEEVEKWQSYYHNPNSTVHIYGKGNHKPGRKMGHVTTITPDR